MQKAFISFAFWAGSVVAAVAYAQQPTKEQQVPNELVQYVRDAQKAGMKENQIQENALNAGWPADMVSTAISSVIHPGGSKPTPNPAATTAAKSGQPAPTAAAEPASAKPAEPPATTAPATASPKSKPAEPTPAPPAAETTAKIPASNPPAKPAVIDRGVPDDYEIGAGDQLQISVWKEPDASVGGAVVRPDGKISMPILKEVSVIGLTPIQAEKLITDQLVQFIAAADVTVIVTGIKSKKIYVVGGVKTEGPISYTYRMTIMQAISEAGGLSDYAKRKKIYVLRHENGRDYRIPFDYDAALKGEKMELNIPMMPGDTLVVPK